MRRNSARPAFSIRRTPSRRRRPCRASLTTGRGGGARPERRAFRSRPALPQRDLISWLMPPQTICTPMASSTKAEIWEMVALPVLPRRRRKLPEKR